jgi:hypothetical protein
VLRPLKALQPEQRPSAREHVPARGCPRCLDPAGPPGELCRPCIAAYAVPVALRRSGAAGGDGDR